MVATTPLGAGCKSVDAAPFARIAKNFPGELKSMSFQSAAKNQAKEAAEPMARPSSLSALKDETCKSESVAFAYK